MSAKDDLLAYIQALLASNRRMRACLNAMAADRAGKGTHRQMVDICRQVTQEDLHGE